jgi:aryl-alcohol dehydrogenase-like predicted oxidoreductase
MKRSLGPGAPDVYPIGFGGMALSEEGCPPEEEAIRLIHAVLDAGVTLIDTSNVYGSHDAEIGHNERLIAKALSQWGGDRDGIVIATKGGRTRTNRRWTVDARPSQLRLACERSLVALGVDRIDLYQLNTPDPDVPFLDSVGALVDLHHEGKIRWIGISNVTVEQIEAARALGPVATVQNQLNPVFRRAVDDGVVAHCAEQGMGFLCWRPVGGWRLPEIGRHRVFRRIASRHGISTHAVALAWSLAKGATVIPIPSARRIEHALDSVSAAHVTLDPSEVKAIDSAWFWRPVKLKIRGRIDWYMRRVLTGPIATED